LDKQAFDSLLEIIDDAVALAKEAMATAAAAQVVPVQQPQVVLTKVASEVYEKTAKSLITAGVFPGKSLEAVKTNLRVGDSNYHLALLEKLASSAVFPMFDDNDERGSLVEKSATLQAYDNLPKSTAMWRKAMDEVENEL
jgi:hypothetical protein